MNKQPTHRERVRIAMTKINEGKTDDQILKEIEQLQWIDFNPKITKEQIERLRLCMFNDLPEDPIPWSHLLDGIVVEVFEDGTIEGYDTSMNQKEVDVAIQKKFDEYLEEKGLVLNKP